MGAIFPFLAILIVAEIFPATVDPAYSVGIPSQSVPAALQDMVVQESRRTLQVHSSPAAQNNFTQVARQAEQARTTDRIQDAIRLYHAGVEMRPAWAEGWWWLGSLYYDQDRFPEAQQALKRFVAIAPDPAPAFALLGLCEYETREYSQALTHFGKWAAKGSPGPAQLVEVTKFHWALLLTRNGQFERALRLLEAAAQHRGRAPELVEAMGLAALRIKNLPQDYPPERRELVWLAGEVALHTSLIQFDRADEYARKLMLHYAQEPNVHYLRGVLFSFEKNTPGAKTEFREELKISRGHVPALLDLARMSLTDTQPSEAVSFAQQALSVDPKNPAAHHLLGRAFLANRQVTEAVRELEIARQLAPDDAAIKADLAGARKEFGHDQAGAGEPGVSSSEQGKGKAQSTRQGAGRSK